MLWMLPLWAHHKKRRDLRLSFHLIMRFRYQLKTVSSSSSVTAKTTLCGANFSVLK